MCVLLSLCVRVCVSYCILLCVCRRGGNTKFARMAARVDDTRPGSSMGKDPVVTHNSSRKEGEEGDSLMSAPLLSGAAAGGGGGTGTGSANGRVQSASGVRIGILPGAGVDHHYDGSNLSAHVHRDSSSGTAGVPGAVHSSRAPE